MIPYSELFRVFGRIGLLSFGGPAAQIALMHKELVDDRDWMTEDGFLRALSFCMLLPGPEAMQLATYAGWRLRGTPGGLLAGLLFVLPGALVIATLVGVYATWGEVPGVQAAFLGIKATVIAIVIQALTRLAKKTLHGTVSYLLAAAAFVGIFALNLPFPLLVLGAGLFGFWRGNHAPAETEPRPAHASASGLRAVAVWLPLWLIPLVTLSLTGADFLATIGWFFAKLAVVTFGGAYAVLAYMSQAVVQTHGWISTGQMIDALGLAETTPGPLILVTQFVAMLAGQLQQGPLLALAAGLVALWATFVPCFLWIFAAAPHLERITGHARLGAALKAISAAVTGIILNLSVWFAMHVLFSETGIFRAAPLAIPHPQLNSLDLPALALTVTSAVLILGLKQRLELTLILMSAAGLALHFL